MHIPVLNQLETRTQWISFLRRERPLAYIKTPLALIDCQSTYLQITLLDATMLDGRQAIKYSLGARYSMAPAWKLIKACHWQLSAIITGLESMDFGSNVRDNSLLGAHTDLTVRKFFAKDKHLLAPTLLGELPIQKDFPEQWDIPALCALLSRGQFTDATFLAAPDKPAPIKGVLLKLLDSAEGWSCHTHASGEVELSYRGKPILALRPYLARPEPRLKRSATGR